MHERVHQVSGQNTDIVSVKTRNVRRAHAFCAKTNLLFFLSCSGSHRAVWPKYGEYEFVPPQRWIHSLEHGAIVALYHPCANRQETLKYKKLVKQCLFRHVITPYEQLSSERPFALVAWGKSLEMSFVDLKLMIGFIRMNALQGPEAIDRDGAYEVMLVEAAKTVSTNDSSLCPSM